MKAAKSVKPAVKAVAWPERTKRRLPQAQRREQLLRAAVKVAAEKGLGRVGHADIARSTGVSTPTAFLYFRDRAALLKAIIEEVDRYYRAMARACHDPSRAPMKRIHDHLFTFWDSLETDREYAIVWLEWSTHFRNEYGIWDAFIEFQEYVISLMAKSVRGCQEKGQVDANISASDSARLIIAGAYALTQLKLMNRKRSVAVQFIEQMLRQALTAP